MSTDLCVSRSSNQLATSREEDVDAKKFSLSSDFIVQTGNIRRCNHLQAIVNPTTKQEITTALKCTLNCWNTYNQQDFVLQKDVRNKLNKAIPQQENTTTQQYHNTTQGHFCAVNV
eukprot:m.53327 g.53327  ORF g.53327 m.53327 type:complete len:116 (-) comp11039_c0_seq1:964-1311(-)